MIPRAVIQAWATVKPWPTLIQVEQDLVLARLIIQIAEHPLLGDELVFRGGTCLHQLVLHRPRRYSEDLDYVRTTHTGIGPVFDALRAVATDIGLDVTSTAIGEHPKVLMRAASETDPTSPLKIKVEINTHETSPALSTLTRPFHVATDWYRGHAQVRTFTPAELIATKIRALYQRKKGRDLFDMWLALTEAGIAGDDIVAAFGPYRPPGITAALAEANLRAKLQDAAFRNDLDALVAQWPDSYELDTAADLVIAEVLSKI